MNIRPFQQQDQEAVIALWQRCELTRPWNDPRLDIARKMTEQPELFLVGLKGDEVVASVMAGFDGHRGWINYLAVCPSWQRQGLARLLMAQVEAVLLARGCPKINLQVREGNAAVLAFYRAMGYLPDAVVSMGKRLINDQAAA